MRNHHCGAPLHNFFERLLNVPFALGVQRAGGLVKQQQFRISENGAGQRDPLALTPRQPNSLCPQMTLVAVGKGIDKLMGMSHLRCGFDCLLARVAGTIGNVVKNVSGKQRRLLGNQSDLLAPAVEWYVAQVDAAKAEAEAGWSELVDILQTQAQESQQESLAAKRKAADSTQALTISVRPLRNLLSLLVSSRSYLTDCL